MGKEADVGCMRGETHRQGRLEEAVRASCESDAVSSSSAIAITFVAPIAPLVSMAASHGLLAIVQQKDGD